MILDVTADNRHIRRRLSADVLYAGSDTIAFVRRSSSRPESRSGSSAFRAMTLMGVLRGIVAVVIPATVIMSATLIATVWKSAQGVVLTSEMLAFFVVAMILIPQINAASSSFWGIGRGPAPPTRGPRPKLGEAGGAAT